MLCAHATQHSNGVVVSQNGKMLQSRSEIEAWDHSHSGVAELSLLPGPSVERVNGEDSPRAPQFAWPESGAARIEISIDAIGFGLGIGFLRRKQGAEDGMSTATGNGDLSKGGSWPHHSNWGCALLDKGLVVSGNKVKSSSESSVQSEHPMRPDWNTFQRGDRLVVEQREGQAPVVFRVRKVSCPHYSSKSNDEEDWVKLATLDTASLLPCGSSRAEDEDDASDEEADVNDENLPPSTGGRRRQRHQIAHSRQQQRQPPPRPKGLLSPYLFLKGLPNSRAQVRCLSGGIGGQGAPLWSPQTALRFHPYHRACCRAWCATWLNRTDVSSCGGAAHYVLSFCDWTWFHAENHHHGSRDHVCGKDQTKSKSDDCNDDDGHTSEETASMSSLSFVSLEDTASEDASSDDNR